MKKGSSAILTCLALFSSHSRSCFVSSLENVCAITVLGAGKSGAPSPEQRAEGERPRAQLLHQARLSTWPYPVLSQLSHLGAPTKQNPASLRPRPRQMGRKGENTHSSPRKCCLQD